MTFNRSFRSYRFGREAAPALRHQARARGQFATLADERTQRPSLPLGGGGAFTCVERVDQVDHRKKEQRGLGERVS